MATYLNLPLPCPAFALETDLLPVRTRFELNPETSSRPCAAVTLGRRVQVGVLFVVLPPPASTHSKLSQGRHEQAGLGHQQQSEKEQGRRGSDKGFTPSRAVLDWGLGVEVD